MINKEFKKETIGMLDIMIKHADKGPSGFWVEDHEGCGNPDIFPEFAEGLKNGRLIQKKHYICPWNTAVMYGKGHGDIITGCYHSCSIDDARFLSAEMTKAILSRFKKGLCNGRYDNVENLAPLLTTNEIAYIKKQKALKHRHLKQLQDKKHSEKAKKVKALLDKYPECFEYRDILECNYGENITVLTEKGPLNFSSKSIDDIQCDHKLDYDEYLDVQIRSWGKQRGWFEMCYYNLPSEFKGRIETISNNRICFERIYVTGMYPDNFSFFDGKEDHVWMDISAFKDFKVGDCVSFFAEVYRYIKTGKGKILDYGLRNPENIKKIEAYKLPTDDEIRRQAIEQIICESCYLHDNCDGINCIRNRKEKNELRKQLFEASKGKKEK